MHKHTQQTQYKTNIRNKHMKETHTINKHYQHTGQTCTTIKQNKLTHQTYSASIHNTYNKHNIHTKHNKHTYKHTQQTYAINIHTKHTECFCLQHTNSAIVPFTLKITFIQVSFFIWYIPNALAMQFHSSFLFLLMHTSAFCCVLFSLLSVTFKSVLTPKTLAHALHLHLHPPHPRLFND